MKIGQIVELHFEHGFLRTLIVESQEEELGLQKIKGFKTTEGSVFYSEADDGRHYNYGNRAFWVKESNEYVQKALSKLKTR